MSKKVKNRKYQYCAFPMSTANLHVPHIFLSEWIGAVIFRDDLQKIKAPFRYFLWIFTENSEMVPF